MLFEILYAESVVKEDIPKLTKTLRLRIKKSIEEKLTTHPEIFGKPLQSSLAGYRSLRVGDYRVIFKIESKIIKILAIGHRNDIYKRNFE